MTEHIRGQLETGLDNVTWRHKLADALRTFWAEAAGESLPNDRLAKEITAAYAGALMPVLEAYGDHRAAQALDNFANYFATEYDDPFGEVSPDTVTAMLRDRADQYRALRPYATWQEQSAAMPAPDDGAC